MQVKLYQAGMLLRTPVLELIHLLQNVRKAKKGKQLTLLLLLKCVKWNL